jgi:hypothetical protein
MMTVEELIEKLKEFPPDMPVLHYDDEIIMLKLVTWVGEMSDKEVSGVVIHNYQPSTQGGDWLTHA